MTDFIARTEIISILKHIFGRFSLYDASVPLLQFLWIYEETTFVNTSNSYRSAAESAFYAKFRQSGGHARILDLRDLSRSISRGLTAHRSFQDGHSSVLAIHVTDIETHVDDVKIIANEMCIVGYGEQESRSQVIDELRRNSADCLRIRFTRAPVTQNVYIFLPELIPETLRTQAIEAAKNFAVTISENAAPIPLVIPTIDIELPLTRLSSERLALPATRFLHDGSRSAERKEVYSWLWFGPELHLRILLGVIPKPFATLRIIVPNANSSENLAQSAIFLNGMRVPRKVETWGEKAGAITALLQISSADQVLGFAVPNSLTLANHNVLAACVDKIELSV